MRRAVLLLVCAWVLWMQEPGKDWEIRAEYEDQTSRVEEQRCWGMLKPLEQLAKETGQGTRYRCYPVTVDPRGPVSLPKARR